NQRYETAIEATKVYSYPTLRQLSRYVKEEAEKLGKLGKVAGVRESAAPARPKAEKKPIAQKGLIAPKEPRSKAARKLRSWRTAARRRASISQSSAESREAAASRSRANGAGGGRERIAVIGMAGQFPL